jgi:hypothetical protein
VSAPAFTWTSRAWPVIQIGIGDVRTEQDAAVWDQARWDDDEATWSGLEPLWQDVTCDAFSFRCEYGRARTTDRFVPGAATIVVWNATGWADPNAEDDPAVLTMRPGRAIRVGVQHTVYGTRWLFRGFIDAMAPVYDPTQPDTVELSCIDALGEVNRAKIRAVDPPVGGGETVTTRLHRLLDAADWPTEKRALAPSGDTVIADDLGGQLADLLGQAADSGGGNVYGDLDGNVAYKNRDWQMFNPSAPLDGSIGNVQTEGYVIPGTPQVDGYLDLALGTATTPDTADMSGAVAVRLTARVRWNAWPASGFPVVVQKQGPGGTAEREYMLFTSGASAYGSTTTVAAANGQITIGAMTLGATQTVGWEMSRGSLAATAIIDGSRLARTFTPGAPGLIDSAAAIIVGSVTAGREARLYWAQLERLRARLVLPGVVGNYLSVADAAPLRVTGDIEIVARIAPTDWTPAATTTIVGRWGPTNSYLLRLIGPSSGALQLNFSTTGADNIGAQSQGSVPGAVDGMAKWVKVTRIAATGVVRFYTAPDADQQPTTWTQLGADVASTPGALFAGTAPLLIGAFGAGGTSQPFVGRIARVIVRNGIGGAAVLDVHEDSGAQPTSSATFPALTGQSVAVVSTMGATVIVQRQPDQLIWRFDANEYAGTGTQIVDPRGRLWTLSAAGAITPKVPAVPDRWVPGDVCPVLWQRPFARADLATRVLIGRDVETALQLDDIEAQRLYGIEPFERTDLLTERDDTIATIGERIMAVRSASAAPRIRSVSIDARTADDALDLAATVDVYKPSRYRCRLQLDRGLVFDAVHMATGVVHEMTPETWRLDLNLDLAAPFEAIGGRWDGAYWDSALWSGALTAGAH